MYHVIMYHLNLSPPGLCENVCLLKARLIQPNIMCSFSNARQPQIVYTNTE